MTAALARGARVSAGVTAAYAGGSLATGVFSAVPSVLLLFYCTQVAGIAPATAAIVIAGPKLVGIIWDPAVGAWSDRSVTRWGRRAPFIAAGAMLLPLAFVALFTVGGGDGNALPIAIAYLALTIGYSLFAVPYSAIPAEASDCPAERERLIGWRLTCVMIGALVGSGLAPHLVDRAGGGARGYAVMSITVAAGCAITMAAAAWAALRFARSAPARAHEAGNLRATAASVWRDRPFVLLALSYIGFLASVGIVSAAMPYFTTQVLARPAGDAGTLLATMLVAAMLSLRGWRALLARYDAIGATVVAAALFGSAVALLLTPIAAAIGAGLFAIFAVIGVGFAGLQIAPFASLAHLIHRRAADGRAVQGLYTGAWIACEKIGLAAGPVLFALALAAMGVTAGDDRWSAGSQLALRFVIVGGTILWLGLGAAAATFARDRTRTAT